MKDTVSDDLAYVREIAQSGASAPLLGGRFLIWWGGLVTAAYIAHYAIILGAFGLGPEALGFLWTGFIIIGLGGYILMARAFPADKPGQSSAGNRVSATVWMASGFVLFSLFAGLTVKSFMIGEASQGFSWSIPVVLGVYGISQLVSGEIANVRWLKLAGLVAIAFVGLTILIIDQPELYLAGALAAALSVFLPGIAMVRQEPSSVV